MAGVPEMNGKVRIATLSAGLIAPLLGPTDVAAAVSEHAAPSLGTIMICSGRSADVYADGPSFREDDLATFTKSGECTNWKPVLPGNYEIGFAFVTTSAYSVNIQCLVRRGNKHVFYKSLNNEGHIYTTVAPGELTRVDMFIARG
jgi:hypothetical protein